jgi:hypothetical protein
MNLVLVSTAVTVRGFPIAMNVLVNVVNARKVPSLFVLHKFLLPCLSCKVTAHIVSVGFSLEHRRQVDTCPYLLTGIFALFLDAFHNLVKAVCANYAHAEEVVGGTEAAEREVALAPPLMTALV